MSNYNVVPDSTGMCYCYPLPVSVIRGNMLLRDDAYYLRYNVRYGNMSWRVVYGVLGKMLCLRQITYLSFFQIKTDGSVVFFWRAEGWLYVMERLRLLARCDGLPLADFEFVHPFSSAIICSLGLYSSEKFVDTFRHQMGRCVLDLKQPLVEVK